MTNSGFRKIRVIPDIKFFFEIGQWFYTGYCFIIFSILFIIFFPLLLIPIIFQSQFKLVGVFNRWWARLLFPLCLLPYKVEGKSKLDPKRQYIFCPNHFSYVDIPTMGLNPHNAIFVGKSDMEKIPLFGFMYRKLHITVDRSRLSSRFNTYKKSMQAVDEGKSLVIYPEGGILTTKDPVMGRFKDGAFRIAIEKQIPLVPVTIPNNWIILPPDKFLIRWGRVQVIFHEPLETKGLTLDNLNELKEGTRRVIENELKKHLK